MEIRETPAGAMDRVLAAVMARARVALSPTMAILWLSAVKTPGEIGYSVSVANAICAQEFVLGTFSTVSGRGLLGNVA